MASFLVFVMACFALCAFVEPYEMEEECSRTGGMCLPLDDCSNLIKEYSGLCPKQKNQGVVCCHGVSNKENRCRMRGGECMPMCNENLVDKKATDCPSDQRCCILV